MRADSRLSATTLMGELQGVHTIDLDEEDWAAAGGFSSALLPSATAAADGRAGVSGSTAAAGDAFDVLPAPYGFDVASALEARVACSSSRLVRPAAARERAVSNHARLRRARRTRRRTCRNGRRRGPVAACRRCVPWSHEGKGSARPCARCRNLVS